MKYSQIVIVPPGVVVAATGDLPGLVDAHLDQCESLPPEVREAGRALLDQLRTSASRVLSQTFAPDESGRSLQLVALEAIAIRRTATDVRELLASKLDVLVSQAVSVDVSVSIIAGADVPGVVHLDSEKVAWAVTTLVGNALRYVQAGSRRTSGLIGVRTSYDHARSEVVVEVWDNGAGIPADTVARLFKRDGLNVRGAGLALLLVADIVAAHGGHVDVRSSTDPANQGTTIRLTIPVR